MEYGPAIKALKEERQTLWNENKPFLEAFSADPASVTAEMRDAYDKRDARIAEIQGDLRRLESGEKLEQGRKEAADTRGVSTDEADAEEKRYEEAFLGYLKRGEGKLSGEHRAVLMERRALSTSQADSDKAGFMIPQGFWHNLQIALKAYGGILPYCHEIRTATGNPMPWPTQDPTAIVGSYLSENTQLGNQDYVFGQGLLNAWTIVSGVVLASIQLVNDSAFDVQGFVTDRIGEAIGRKVAAELHSGSGTSALLGIETALAARGKGASPGLGGVYKSGTATNWAATAGGSAFTYQGGTTAQAKLANGLIGFDDIIGMIETVDPAYRQAGKCVFVCNDQTMAMLRTITDSHNHPLWNPDPRAGGVDDFYGYQVVIDQNTSSVSTTASTVGGLLFGDFNRAVVVRTVDQADVMALHERYADFLQVGYLGYVRMDARSNDLRAAALYSTNAT